ncbi:UbiX family flavin prenyltransferase [Clostridium sp. 'White wine YQ']|uniref:UbiX family flavin prenyltransferase n=1 Tax=Clostridium sp. 'White wine YQ' TaxID=3027474 RepID=UPI002366E9D5|nr:flavin prenyltransferase UbiX [Clostridium sp. 'White wine YQ']MDD7794686.1 UbiX family flavin prenyltransferase [Clostridium sp. 'White wine YQ']
MKKVLIGITGASGSLYAKRLIEELLQKDIFVYIVASDNGKKVMEYETSINLETWVYSLKEKYKNIQLEDIDNMFSNVASGSYKLDGVIIIPCSMGTLGEISNGISKNLIARAADVALKERRNLIIVPRETPFNTIHLENMLKLSKMGATILPAMPGFYHKPETLEDLVNFVIGKILDYLSIENDLFKKWGN